MACSPEDSTEEKDMKVDGLATVEALKEFDTKKAAERLALGPIFEFDVKFQDPNDTKLEVWLDIYKDGERLNGKMGQVRTEFVDIKRKSEHIGWSMMDPLADTLDLRLYSYNAKESGTYTSQRETMLKSGYPTSHKYLIDSNINLKPGKEYPVAAFYQSNSKNTIRGYNTLDQLIKNNHVVILMKVKVEEKIGSGANSTTYFLYILISMTRNYMYTCRNVGEGGKRYGTSHLFS